MTLIQGCRRQNFIKELVQRQWADNAIRTEPCYGKAEVSGTSSQ